MQRAIPHQEEAGIVGYLSQFVEVESQRVGAFDTGEPGR